LLNNSAVDFLGAKVRFVTVYTQPGTAQNIMAEMRDRQGDHSLVLQRNVHIDFRNCVVIEVYHPSR